MQAATSLCLGKVGVRRCLIMRQVLGLNQPRGLITIMIVRDYVWFFRLFGFFWLQTPQQDVTGDCSTRILRISVWEGDVVEFLEIPVS